MDSLLDHPLTLPPGATLRLPARPLLLQLQTGRLWLTCSGEAADQFITGGQSLTIDGSHCVIENDSQQPARLRLSTQRSARPAAAVWAGLAARWRLRLGVARASLMSWREARHTGLG